MGRPQFLCNRIGCSLLKQESVFVNINEQVKQIKGLDLARL